jgi:NADH dehydrogenase (ubiquinone) 1 beta subcomplex subunit 7
VADRLPPPPCRHEMCVSCTRCGQGAGPLLLRDRRWRTGAACPPTHLRLGTRTERLITCGQINIAFRDHCAHKLVDLNECRRENYYLPWTCQHEKHSYEKCQYKECVCNAALSPPACSQIGQGSRGTNVCPVLCRCAHTGISSGAKQWWSSSRRRLPLLTAKAITLWCVQRGNTWVRKRFSHHLPAPCRSYAVHSRSPDRPRPPARMLVRLDRAAFLPGGTDRLR